VITTIAWEKERVVILNQNRLPDEAVYESCASVHEVAEAIRSLKVRGAPLIGVTAAFGLALGVTQYKGSQEDFPQYYSDIREELASTRPTAVNLFWALQRMDNVYQEHGDKSPTELGSLLVEEARAMYADDIRTNELIGHHGAQLIHGSSRIMTICNAGALATCGYGTALGVVRTAFRQQKIEQVWACETRPVLQGARLTVWELMQDKIPVKLITDSMAGYIMKLGQVDSIVVGADRIAANGDTANKIGTYTLAVLAQYHGVPFYVAAPQSTIDLSIASGKEIPIEERAAEEVRLLRGVPLTVREVEVFNPAFDVTDHHLITGIITERGVLTPPYETSLRP
jgi:methylthioribose-1-phosphate isomerase